MSYAERKEARINRLHDRASKKGKEGNALINESCSMTKCIPMGQPILVGHHSERGHRKLLERSNNKMRKGCEALDYSDELERRAEAAENNNAIMSDDPEAIRKIKEKMQLIEVAQEKTKKVNVILRKLKTYENAIKVLDKETDDLSKEILKGLISQYGYYAIPPERIRAYYWSTSHNSAERNRLKKRLEVLQKKEENGPMEFTVNDSQGNEIKVDEDEGRIRVHFPYKPNDETRSKIKSYPISMKWSRYATAWVRKIGPGTNEYFKEQLIEALKASDE